MINVMGFRFAQRTARPLFAPPSRYARRRGGCVRHVPEGHQAKPTWRSLGRGGFRCWSVVVVLRVQQARSASAPAVLTNLSEHFGSLVDTAYCLG